MNEEVVRVEERSILIVANQTAAGSHLMHEIRRRMEQGPCRFTLVVPATPPPGKALWTEGEANAHAQRRMEVALTKLAETGAKIDGAIGDASPAEAVAEQLMSRDYDEIIVSTLPPGISRWLKQDLPHRIERRFEIPVTHVIAQRESASL
jgi:cell pole-organizing protein PopZ